MSTTPFYSCRASGARPRHQRGQAALLLVMMVGIAAALLIYGMVDTTSAALRRDKDMAAVLAQAKHALIGRAVADDNRLGTLPCPDTDDDGSAETFVGSDCPSYIGRLPWRTLGLPDLRDASGERLWYVLSPRFRDNAAVEPINSDTKGNLTVHQDGATVTITAEAVAVIFAPGPVVAGQIRDPANANNAANYLDTTAGVNNATAAGPFISAQATTTFNDRLLVITTVDLMPTVEQRVARTMLTLLQGYRAASSCACYPWAANNFDDDSVDGRIRGGVPIESALPEAWGSGGIPSVPSWLIGNNEWGHVFYYAVAPSEAEDHAAGTLTVDGSSKNLVLITPGPAGASRPSTNLPDYLADSENSDGDNTFQTPSSTAYARNRLYTLP